MPSELRTDQPIGAVPPRTRGPRPGLVVGAVALLAVAVTAVLVLVLVPRPESPVTPAGPPPAPIAAQATCGGQAPPKADGGTWECTWSDEFEGTALSPVWELVPYGLGSACMFDDPEYVQVRDGALNLLARRLPADHWCTTEWGLEYGGGGVQSSNGFAQQYGRFEVRAKIPDGAGFWPAIWLLPDDDSFDGEIDVMEAYGGRDDRGDATLHSPAGEDGPQVQCDIAPDMSADFHTYRMEWSPDRITIFYDDRLCADFTGGVSLDGGPPSIREAFDKPYHVLLNLAVQPWWPPDASTPFPATMQVDYVRAWR